MRGVRCSWVDMMKVRQLLSGGKRGDQAALQRLRCVDKSTVSAWKAVCELIDAVGEVGLSQLSHFQPTHAREIVRHLRKTAGKNWAATESEKAAEWMERCEAEEWTIPQLRLALNRGDDGRRLPSACGTLAAMAGGGVKFGTVYADPPWPYRSTGYLWSASDHYAEMGIDELCRLPVAMAAAERSHLHLWTTNAFLFEARRVLEAWGFEYKSCFVWVKPQLGMGNYWMVSHEFLLLGVRGGLTFADRSLRSWLEADRGRHSEKPEEVRRLIKRASPGPRLELFARRPAPGWTVWGNEVATEKAR